MRIVDMKRILLPTDFSSGSIQLIEEVVKRFSKDSVNFFICTAYFQPHGTADMLVSIADILREDCEKQLTDLSQSLIHAYNIESVRMSTRAVYGRVEDVIHEICQVKDISLVVMATKGSQGFLDSVIGTHSSQIALKIRVPFLVFPEGTSFSLSPIHLALDQKGLSEATTQKLRSIAAFFKSEIKSVHIKTQKEEESPVEYPVSFDGGTVEITDPNVTQALKRYMEDREGILALINRRNGFWAQAFQLGHSAEIIQTTKTPVLALHE